VALPFTVESIILRQKKNEWKLKHFTIQKYNLPKILSKKTQNPSRSYYNSTINLKFPTQAKISSFQNPHIKNRPII
jgi:hypothetical protein